MRRLFSALAVIFLLITAGCTADNDADGTPPVSDDAVVQRLGFAGLTGQQIVEQIDQSDAQRPLAYSASVRPTGLLLADDQGQTTVPLPDDKFYLSIAPYVSRTHECHFHSLATCNGELKDTDVTVKITASDGTVLVDEQTRTYPGNGFVAFWIPKDLSGTVEITLGDGKTGTTPFSSMGDEDATCLTTLKVS